MLRINYHKDRMVCRATTPCENVGVAYVSCATAAGTIAFLCVCKAANQSLPKFKVSDSFHFEFNSTLNLTEAAINFSILSSIFQLSYPSFFTKFKSEEN